MPQTAKTTLTRRTALSIALAGPLAGAAPALASRLPIRAVAFDAFPIFDLRAVFAVARSVAPERGDALRDIWLSKIFAYTWLRTTAHRYEGFEAVIGEALDFAAAATDVALDGAQRERLIGAFGSLPIWPDVKDQLRRLQDRGLRLAFLSNMSEPMLRANMRHNGIDGLFDVVLSTDRAQAFKPAPEAYALAPKALGLSREQIAFAAFAAWDAAGAAWFGFPTVWVNRLGQPGELGAASLPTGRDLSVLTTLIDAS